jgi:hypothetical protein
VKKCVSPRGTILAAKPEKSIIRKKATPKNVFFIFGLKSAPFHGKSEGFETP